MKQLVVLILLVSLLGGCASGRTPSRRNPSSSETAVRPTPAKNSSAMPKDSLSPALQTEILAAIGKEQNHAPDQLQITTIEAVDWPDACLGLAAPDEFCAQILTPGWAIAVTDGEQTWQYRTDLDAIQVRWADTPE